MPAVYDAVMFTALYDMMYPRKLHVQYACFSSGMVCAPKAMNVPSNMSKFVGMLRFVLRSLG
jgi:hypothetical protein